MNKCIIEKCKNNEGTDRFFQFPKDEIVLDKWKRFCRCENIDLSTALLCWAHFTENDFENLTEYETGSCQKLLLKQSAYPSIMACSRVYNEEKECDIICNGHERREASDNNFVWVEKVVNNEFDRMSNKEKETFTKSVVLGLNIFEEYEKELTEPLLDLDELKSAKSTEDDVVDVSTFNLIQKVGEKIMETKSLEETIEKLRLEKFQLISQIEKSQKLWQKRLAVESMTDKHLRAFLTPSQVHKVKNGKYKNHFSEAEFEKYLHLYFLSSSAYNLLLHWNYPFPARRSMQRHIKNKKIKADEFLKAARTNYYKERSIIKALNKSKKQQTTDGEIDESNKDMQIDDHEDQEMQIDDYEEEQAEKNQEFIENDTTVNLEPAIFIESQLNEHSMEIQVKLKSNTTNSNNFKIEPNDVEAKDQQNDDLEIRLDEYFSIID